MLLLLLVVLQCCSVGGAAVAQCCSVGSVGVGCTLVGGQFAATGLWTGCRGSNELSSVSSKIWADGRDLSDPMDTAAGLATANDRKKMVMITTIEVREQIFLRIIIQPKTPLKAPSISFAPPPTFFLFFGQIFSPRFHQITSSPPPNSSFSQIKFLLIFHTIVLHQIADSPRPNIFSSNISNTLKNHFRQYLFKIPLSY